MVSLSLHKKYVRLVCMHFRVRQVWDRIRANDHTVTAGHVCCICIDVMHGSIGWLLGMERRSALSLLAVISYLELLNEDYTSSSAYANI